MRHVLRHVSWDTISSVVLTSFCFKNGDTPTPPARVFDTRSPVSETKEKEKQRRAKINPAQVREASQVDAYVAELLRELVALVSCPPGKARATGLLVSELEQLRQLSGFAGQGQADVAGSVKLDPFSFFL